MTRFAVREAVLADAQGIADVSADSWRTSYRGILPDLFKEGRGVVAQGQLGDDGQFVATEVLAKHDENYMPPEAAEALRKAGKPVGAPEQFQQGKTVVKQ